MSYVLVILLGFSGSVALAEFNKAADRVCRYHGFDRRLF